MRNYQEIVDSIEFGTTIYLTNAFSLNMLKKTPAKIEIDEIPLTKWYDIARYLEWDHGCAFECYIGHESTVQLYNKLFEAQFKARREFLAIEKGYIVVFQVRQRLEEGKVLSKEELERLVQEGKIAIYIVAVNI